MLDEHELVELTDDEGSETIDTAVVESAISDACSLIDSYCAGRYSVPFDPVPTVIRQLAVDLAIYNLYSRRGDAVPENRVLRQQNALKLLDRIASGRITIGEASGGSVAYVSEKRRFTSSAMRDF